MTPLPGNAIVRSIRQLVSPPPHGGGDRDLLERWLNDRSELAFASLVERHGPTVLGVCQATLQNHHEAEDAFQPTFLALAQQAISIRRRDSLASWLHGVAHRVSCKARAAGARRQALHAKVPAANQLMHADDLSWGEVRGIVHEEIAALPERWREPLIHCCLQGLTQEEAAQRLHWSPTKVKGRLQRGREMLRRRLQRRGLGLGTALGATVLSTQVVAAPLRQHLVAATLKLIRSRKAASAMVQALATAAVRPLMSTPTILLTSMIVVSVALAAGFGQLSWQPEEQKPHPADSQPSTLQAPPRLDLAGDPLPDGAVARIGTVRFNHGDGLNGIHFTPDGKTIVSEGGGIIRRWDAATGKELNHIATGREWAWESVSALSPDGRTLTLMRQENSDKLRIWDLIQGKEVRAESLPVRRSGWNANRHCILTPDGGLRGSAH
jgi:RNA polymerase sigma factor (sigma-70 family)